MSVFIFKDFLFHMCTINYSGSILNWVVVVKPVIIESGKCGKATAKVSNPRKLDTSGTILCTMEH